MNGSPVPIRRAYPMTALDLSLTFEAQDRPGLHFRQWC